MDLKVLIVDKTSLFHKILNTTFTNTDINLIICNNATEGMAKLESQEIDFVCVSLYLDDSDGISFTKTLRQNPNYKHTPVILFTSEESNTIYTQALAAGLTEVFQKKDVQQLVNFIQRFTLQQQPIDGRVLYIEDTLSHRQMIIALFESKNLSVDAFATAEDAWDAFLLNDYDIVVTDIILEGGMTGMALTNQIRRLNSEKGDVPILALTGFDDISRRIDLFYLGVSDYVIKPVIEEELLARVRSLIDNKKFHMEAAEQKRQAEEQKILADSANKSKSAFLANMSHEIRTPLNAILGFVELLKEENKGRKSMDYIEIIDKSSKSLNQVIDDILDFSKIESGKLDIQLVDFLSIEEFQSITYLFDAKCAEKSLSLKLDLADNLPKHLYSDPIRIKQVIANLLSNAIKFSNDNRKIIVKISYDNNQLHVIVKDQGKGIAADKLEHIFGAFNQEEGSTTQNYGGTGLGLSISKNLIQLLGGKISVKSELGYGSQFSFSIPVERGEVIAKKQENKVVAELNTEQVKLLLVEDDSANQMLMKIALGAINLNYDLAEDGNEAVESFKNNHYDLVLMDENMPNMNGIEATRYIRLHEQENKLAHTPIIALTANALSGDRERFINAGMDDYLSKPAKLDKLKEMICQFIDKS